MTIQIPTPLPVASINRARVELARKTACEIHTDTAYTWASRAFIAYQNAHRAMLSGDPRSANWVRDGDEYAHEAVEHAALGELGGCHNIRTSELTKTLADLRAEAVKVP